MENDPDCRETLIANNPKLKSSKTFYKDIRDLNPKDLMRDTGMAREKTFLVIGGPPCQSFSSAGQRSSIKSTHGDVVYNYFKIIKELKPRFFVFENVRGLLSAAIQHCPLKFREHPQELAEKEEERLGSVVEKIVLPNFKRLGYEVVYGLLCAADYGTPQVRHRVFFLGSRDREFKSGIFRKQTGRPMTALDLIPPTHHKFASYSPIKPWRTLNDQIGQLKGSVPDPNDCYTYSSERKKIFKSIPPGKS